MVEYEKKLLLSEKEYEALLRYFCPLDPPVRQVNYYFDTAKLSMNRKGITCRIREKDGKLCAIRKEHKRNACDRSLELPIPIKNGLEKNGFTDAGLILYGSLTTERTALVYWHNYRMVVDRNTYCGYTDYELEIEYDEGYEPEADFLVVEIVMALAESGITVTKQQLLTRMKKSKSKSERFFKRHSR